MDSSSETSSVATVASENEEMQQDQLVQKFGSSGLPRHQVLGFKPQREIMYSKYLPYAEKIDQESLEKLAEIKANFGKAVLIQEMKPGWEIWASRLMK